MARKKRKKKKFDIKRALLFILIAGIAYAASLYEGWDSTPQTTEDSKLGMELAIPQFTKSTKSQVIEQIGRAHV